MAEAAGSNLWLISIIHILTDLDNFFVVEQIWHSGRPVLPKYKLISTLTFRANLIQD